MTPNGQYPFPPWVYAKHIRRQEKLVAVMVGGSQLVGANPNRIGLVISCGNPGTSQLIPVHTEQSAVSTATTGVKASIALGATAVGNNINAGTVETTGSGVVSNLQLVRSATTYNLATVTTSGTVSLNIPLLPGDTVQWNVITAVATAVNDYFISATEFFAPSAVYLSINSPAVAGKGIMLPQNTRPLVLWKDVIGDALTEDIYAAADAATTNVTVWDLFY